MGGDMEFDEAEPVRKAAAGLNGYAVHFDDTPEVRLIQSVLGDPTGETWSRCSGLPADALTLPESRRIWRALNAGAHVDDAVEIMAKASLSLHAYVALSTADTMGTFWNVHLEAVRAAYRTRRMGEVALEMTRAQDGDPGRFADMLASLKSDDAGGMKSELAARSYDPSKIIEKPEAVFSLGGTTICTAGNITALTSQAKAGKSGFIGGMLGCAMGNDTDGADYLGLGGHNYGGMALLHFDTEQSPYDWQQLVNSATRRAKLANPPAWLLSYSLTGLPASKCRDLVKYAMAQAAKRFKGIYAVIIDGIGDLVNNPNDEAECFPLITELHGLAIEHKTSIISILHLNPASESKSRGHLGSQLERKCESNLMLEKDASGVTRIWGTKQRGKMITKSQARAFCWNDDARMHVTCEAGHVPENSSGRPVKYDFSALRIVVATDPAKAERKMQIMKRLKALDSEIADISEKSLRLLLQESVDLGVLVRTGDPAGGFRYHLAPVRP